MENNVCQVKRERIKFLRNENKELNLFLKENRENFKNWLEENFKKININGDSIEIFDNTNSYLFSIEDNMLRLKKQPNRNCGFGGFSYHPMEMMMYKFMENKEQEMEEVIYEGGFIPKKKETNIFPLLKEDLINKGELSTKIKKYILDDRKLRIEAEDKLDMNSMEINTLESEIKKMNEEELKNEFSEKNLSELFKNKAILVKGGKYNFNKYNGFEVESICFKKETKDKYYLEFVFVDDEEYVLNINKKDFKISKYIF